MWKSVLSIIFLLNSLGANSANCFLHGIANVPCNTSFLTCYDPTHFELKVENLEHLSRYPSEVSEELIRKFSGHNPSLMIERVKNEVGEKLLPLFLSDRVAPRWGEALEILKEFELDAKTPYGVILDKLNPFLEYKANIDGYRKARRLAESMRRSGRFKFFKARRPIGQAEEPITASTFVPGESYTVNISKKSMFMIGEGFRKKPGETFRSHESLKSAQYPDSTFHHGGSIRVKMDGNLQISAYHNKQSHKTHHLEEYIRSLDIDVEFESFEGKLP